MNIFHLDYDPILNAQYHCNKHIVKMPLETAQMLCTALWRYGIVAPYKLTHKGHPCTLWAGNSNYNYAGLALLGLHLCKEYTYRYGKRHKCEDVILKCLDHLDKIVPSPATPLPLCMPDEYKVEGNSVQSYRNYYIYKATEIKMEYTGREVPTWLSTGDETR